MVYNTPTKSFKRVIFMVSPEENSQTTETLPTNKTDTLKPRNFSGVLIAFGISLLLVAVLSLLFGQKIGYKRGVSYATEQAKIMADGEIVTASNVKALRLKTEQLENQLVTTKQERDISLANLTELRHDIQELKVTNLQLAQGQEFLTKELAKAGGVDLQIIGAKIAPLPENAYEYRFDIGRIDENNTSKTLRPKLTLLSDSDMVEIPLKPKTYDINGIVRIRGRFVMPKEFYPKQVKLELSAGGQSLKQIYNWGLGKPVDNLPYTLADTPDADQRPVSAEENATGVVAKVKDSNAKPATDNKDNKKESEKSVKTDEKSDKKSDNSSNKADNDNTKKEETKKAE